MLPMDGADLSICAFLYLVELATIDQLRLFYFRFVFFVSGGLTALVLLAILPDERYMYAPACRQIEQSAPAP